MPNAVMLQLKHRTFQKIQNVLIVVASVMCNHLVHRPPRKIINVNIARILATMLLVAPEILNPVNMERSLPQLNQSRLKLCKVLKMKSKSVSIRQMMERNMMKPHMAMD